ncbi:Protein of unknown function, partial [Gryllus bimaculatus]
MQQQYHQHHHHQQHQQHQQHHQQHHQQQAGSGGEEQLDERRARALDDHTTAAAGALHAGAYFPSMRLRADSFPVGLYHIKAEAGGSPDPAASPFHHQVVPGGYTFREDAKDGLEEALPAPFKAQEDDFRRATYAYQHATEEYLRHQSA